MTQQNANLSYGVPRALSWVHSFLLSTHYLLVLCLLNAVVNTTCNDTQIVINLIKQFKASNCLQSLSCMLELVQL